MAQTRTSILWSPVWALALVQGAIALLWVISDGYTPVRRPTFCKW